MKSEWNITSLRNLVGYISKGIVPSYADKESKTTIRVLNQRCNRNFRISYVESRLHDVAKKKVAAERYLKPNDILINSTGKGTAGRIAQIDYVPYDTTVDGHMIIIRANELVTQMYLAYALKSHQWEVLQLDEGSTGQTELNRERLLDEIMICYPTSKTEQERVVAVLEGIDEKIKNNIAINEELLKLAKDIADANAEGGKLGLSADEVAFYDALTKPQAIKDFYEHDELIAITKELTDLLRKNRTIDWQKKESARAGMRRLVKRLLKKHKYPPEGMNDAVQTVISQCEMWTDNVMTV